MAKLGTHKRPAVVRVRTDSQGEKIVALCNERGWQVIVGVEADRPEDISDVEKLLRASQKTQAVPRPPSKPSPNDFCPCRSGKKFRKCCGVPDSSG
jgi:SWIM/SEC-C metal-binding protein